MLINRNRKWFYCLSRVMPCTMVLFYFWVALCDAHIVDHFFQDLFSPPSSEMITSKDSSHDNHSHDHSHNHSHNHNSHDHSDSPDQGESCCSDVSTAFVATSGSFSKEGLIHFEKSLSHFFIAVYNTLFSLLPLENQSPPEPLAAVKLKPPPSSLFSLKVSLLYYA